MTNTLIVYESHHGTAAKTAMMIGTVVGNTRIFSADDAPQDLSAYQSVVMVFCLYGLKTAQRMKQYLEPLREQLKGKNIALVGVGLSDRQEFPAVCEQLKGMMGCEQPLIQFVQGELRIARLTEDECVQIQRFEALNGQPLADRGFFRSEQAMGVALTIRHAFVQANAPMSRDYFLHIVDEYLKNHKVCALATGKGEWVRCTPLEYIYQDQKLYVFTEGGMKFKGIWENPKVSVAVYGNETSFKEVNSLQICGEAKFISPESQEYRRICEVRGLNADQLARLPMTIYLVRITPLKYEMLDASFRKQGYDSRQETVL